MTSAQHARVRLGIGTVPREWRSEIVSAEQERNKQRLARFYNRWLGQEEPRICLWRAK